MPKGHIAVLAPTPGSFLSVDVTDGEQVAAGQTLAILEAMKMETVISAPTAGRVTEVRVEPGDLLTAKQVIFVLEPMDSHEIF